ncbi:MAG TPA: hypothetical protein PLG59_14760, partial [bacterium]|nr:hypothetical protein [bacterium]
AVLVMETPPAEWKIFASSSGILSSGVITWTLGSFDGAETLRYYVTPPKTATGEAVFSGIVGDREIGGMSTMAAYELPAGVRLPQTTGPYSIGTFLVHLIDESRGETFTDDPNDKRELMVQVWYPANPPEGQSPGLVCPGFAAVRSFFMAPFSVQTYFWDGLEVLVKNAVWDAAVLNRGLQYPVLIYSHGNGGFRWMNVSLFEELASHGYIIASIDHTYNAIATQFPDGRVIGRWGDVNPSLHEQDVQFVLDQLEKLDTGQGFEILDGLLDLGRVGVFGMSMGGGIATRTMQDDPRFKAGVILDWSAEVQELDQPVMFLHDGSSPGNPVLRAGGYDCRIRGTAHDDFSDAPLWWRLLALPGNWPGSTADDPVRVTRIIADYTLAFFDKILKGKTVPLLDGPSPDYPEVEFTIYGNPQGLSGISGKQWAMY